MDAPHWQGRRVLVTGCAGFLGGAVSRALLDRGADVVGLVHQSPTDLARHRAPGKFHAIRGRAEDTFRIYSALAVHEIDAVFHLATGPVFAADRVAGAVVEAVRRFDTTIPVVVAHPDDGLRLAQQKVPVPLGVARFGEVFGPGDRKPFRTVPAILNGDSRRPDGSARDFVFLDDAAVACLALAESLTPHPSLRDETFRSGWSLTDRQMAIAVRDVIEGRSALLLTAKPQTNPLDWQPSRSFADAVAETIAWYRAEEVAPPILRRVA
ncbi:MAG TPA: NAD-dependent epimerase/dehydratase family protein [Gemmataceae bacterium]|nr:NAD-dependent epimerase/dehydratase family protein [Gemmataceae bacterium]